MPTTPSDRSHVTLTQLTKRFAAVTALNAVDLELRGGEVHALCGENGAGKSTLIQLLGGVFRPDSGRIMIGGDDVQFHSPADSLAKGIGIIHQELNLVENFTVAQNLALGNEPCRGPFIAHRAIANRAKALLADLRFDLDPEAKVSDLTVSQRQQVEIARAIGRNARILVLDEPTAALSRAESQRLFEIITSLKARGHSILFVSHHLEDVFAIADTITVLRDGRKIGAWPASELTLPRLVGQMVGEAIDSRQGPPRVATAPPLLNISGAVGQTLRGVDLEIRPGEVLGLAGLAGSGQEELAAAIFGASRLTSGRIVWKGEPHKPRHPADARAKGIAYVPPDRRRQGLVPSQGILENLTLAGLRLVSRLGWLSQRARKKLAKTWCERFEVAARGISQNVLTLSGGNQQKVLLARWAALEPDLYILNEPTRGIDVKTREAIHRWIEDLARAGRAILLVSSDTQELIRLSDRCVILRSGKVNGEMRPPDLTEHRLVAAMMEESR